MKKRTRARPRPQRRTAEEARALILAAAEKRLAASGPAGIRLQDVAADVGVSHPAILHHFGSREGLVRAVVDHALVSLQLDLIKAIHTSDGSLPDGAAILDRVSETLADRGHGRLLAWLTLEGYADTLDTTSVRSNWKAITDAHHQLRIAAGVKADYQDTEFTVILGALAIFALAVVGRPTFRMAGVTGDHADERTFRRWLADLLASHLRGDTGA